MAGGGVLVAGGTGALGAAVTGVLLDAGREVTATWINPDDRDTTQQAVGDRGALTLLEADLTDPAAADSAVRSAGSLGAVVNLVGGYSGGAKVGEAEVGVLERMLALNVRPGFLLARAAMPLLVEAGGGAFVAVSARAALDGSAGAAAYAASKAAVLGLVRSIDAEHGPDGVRCNAIVPNVIDTPANRNAMPKSDRSRWTAPKAIGEVVRFLVSDESRAVSGAAIPV